MQKISKYEFGDKLLLKTIYNDKEYYHLVLYLRKEGTKAAVVHENSKVVMLVPMNNLFVLS